MRRVALVLTLFLLCSAMALAAAPAPTAQSAPTVATAAPAVHAVALPTPAQWTAAPPAWLAPQFTCPGSIIQRCDMYCQRRGCGTIIGPPPSCTCTCSC